MFANRVRRELLFVAILFLAGGLIGTRGLRSHFAAGFRPFFYQSWFGAAVMEACGRGFYQPGPGAPQSLEDFLAVKVDAFNCADLPADLATLPAKWYQRLYRYLELSLALVWRVRGVSWSHLNVLYGTLCGAVAALAYGLLRLGAGRLLSACGALALISSPLNLINLPNIRDYCKAPFQMALILVMACLVLYGTTRRRVLGLAGAGGAILGIGLGFRPDLLLAAAPIAIAILGFLPLPWRGTLRHRLSAIAIFVVTTLVGGAPIFAAYREGGNTPHVMLLGFADPFTEALGLDASAYDVLPKYSDRNAELLLRSDVIRRQGSTGNLSISTAEYDREMSHYLGRVVRELPADVIARAYAAVLKVFESPADWEATQHCLHFSGGFKSFCDARMSLLSQGLPFAGPLCLLTLAGLVLVAPRLGLFALIVVAFFAGGAAIQFHERHYFYLEFMPWWVLAFLLQRGVDGVWQWRRSGWREALARVWRWERHGMVTLALVIGGLALALVAARAYQHRAISGLLTQYATATASPLSVRWRTVAPGQVRAEVDDDRLALVETGGRTRSIGTEFFRADFGGPGCGYALIVPMLRYMVEDSFDDLSTPRPMRLPAGGATISAVFPAYAAVMSGTGGWKPPYRTTRFAGIEMREEQASCLVSLQRIDDLGSLPFLWHAVMRPGEEAPPYYQTLARWERRDGAGIPRLYTSGTAGVARWDLVAPLTNLPQAIGDMVPAVHVEGDRAVIDGPIAHPFAVLLTTVPRVVPAGGRAVLQGRLDRGRIIFALTDGKQFLEPTAIAGTGPFAIAAEVPSAGTYQVVLMNRDGRLTHGTHLEIERFGWVPASPAAPPATR